MLYQPSHTFEYDDPNYYPGEQDEYEDCRPTCDICGENFDEDELHEGATERYCDKCIYSFKRDYTLLEKVANERSAAEKVELSALITDLLSVEEIIKILYRYIEEKDIDCTKFIKKHIDDVVYALEEYRKE